jgi:hypothetical protein
MIDRRFSLSLLKYPATRSKLAAKDFIERRSQNLLVSRDFHTAKQIFASITQAVNILC